MQPLTVSNPAVLQSEDRWDRWLVWFPIVGWSIGAHRQARRIRRAKTELIPQIQQRDAFPHDLWQRAGLDPALAERVAKAIATAIGWHPNRHFHPDDPLRLLTLDTWEGLGMLITELAVFQSLNAKRIKPIAPEVIRSMESFADYVRTVATGSETVCLLQSKPPVQNAARTSPIQRAAKWTQL